MILAIPLAGDRFCEHFGRADQFVMFAIDEGLRTFTELKRVVAPPHEPGVLPRWLAEQGAQVVIAGGLGPRAQQMLAEQGVRVVLGAASQIPEELTRAFLNEERADEACRDPRGQREDGAAWTPACPALQTIKLRVRGKHFLNRR